MFPEQERVTEAETGNLEKLTRLFFIIVSKEEKLTQSIILKDEKDIFSIVLKGRYIALKLLTLMLKNCK